LTLPQELPALITPQATVPPSHSWEGDLWTRSQLLGDGFGLRSQAAESGVTFFADLTQYYQGVTTGGLEQEFEYGGRGDYLLDFDTSKLGLWKGGHFSLRGESRFGVDVNGLDGVAAPTNFAMAVPRPNETVTALTGLQFTQDLTENISVFLGKLNLLDGTPGSYVRGMRLNQFWNSAMQNNLSRTYLLPSTLGGGLTVRSGAEPVFNFYLLNTKFTPTTSGLSTLFSNGVVLYGDYRVPTNWFDLPGHTAVSFLYSTAQRTLLDSNPSLQIRVAQAGVPIETRTSSWTATCRFSQALHADPDNEKRTWTVNSDFGLTDGNPNPIRWFANVSLVGYSPLPTRKADTIGIGYYHLGFSTSPVAQALGFSDEDGVELYYNAAITPWFHLTPDLQILHPAQRANPLTILFGVRGRLSF
jgi:porin